MRKRDRKAAVMRKRLKAQSIIEYVTLLAIVATALITMQLYFKQGIQAGVKSFADYIGSQKNGTAVSDYDYLYMTDGIEGLQSVSNTSTHEDGKETAKGPHAHFDMVYDIKQKSATGGIGTWSVGIERAQVGRMPYDYNVPVEPQE